MAMTIKMRGIFSPCTLMRACCACTLCSKERGSFALAQALGGPPQVCVPVRITGVQAKVRVKPALRKIKVLESRRWYRSRTSRKTAMASSSSASLRKKNIRDRETCGERGHPGGTPLRAQNPRRALGTRLVAPNHRQSPRRSHGLPTTFRCCKPSTRRSQGLPTTFRRCKPSTRLGRMRMVELIRAPQLAPPARHWSGGRSSEYQGDRPRTTRSASRRPSRSTDGSRRWGAQASLLHELANHPKQS